MSAIRNAAIALYMVDYPGDPGHPDTNGTDEMMFEKYEAHYVACVRAVLLAIREPTDAMVEACEENFAADAWRDMVDAALNETITAPDKPA